MIFLTRSVGTAIEPAHTSKRYKISAVIANIVVIIPVCTVTEKCDHAAMQYLQARQLLTSDNCVDNIISPCVSCTLLPLYGSENNVGAMIVEGSDAPGG
jgi:hypothetical protein